jgi:Putative sensor
MAGMDSIGRVTVTLLRLPFTRRARRDLSFCLIGVITGALGFVAAAALLLPAIVVSGSVVGTVIGLAGLIAAIALARLLAGLHRWVLRIVAGERVGPPVPFRPGTGPLGRLDRRLRDRDGWRAVAYTGVKLPLAFVEGYAVAGVVNGLVGLVYPLVWLLFRNHPPGTVLGPLVWFAPIPGGRWEITTLPGTLAVSLSGATCVIGGVLIARAITVVDARMIRALLGPSRVSELERTRAIAVEDAVAALRRVERDLHDGPRSGSPRSP